MMFVILNILSSISIVIYALVLQSVNEQSYINYILFNTILFFFSQVLFGPLIVGITRESILSKSKISNYCINRLLALCTNKKVVLTTILLGFASIQFEVFFLSFIMSIIWFNAFQFHITVNVLRGDKEQSVFLYSVELIVRLVFALFLYIYDVSNLSLVYVLLSLTWALPIVFGSVLYKLDVGESFENYDFFNFIKGRPASTLKQYYIWAVAAWFQFNADKWLVVVYFSASEALIYFTLMQVIFSPVLLLSNSINRNYLKRFYQYSEETHRFISSKKYAVLLLLFMIFLLLIFFIAITQLNVMNFLKIPAFSEISNFDLILYVCLCLFSAVIYSYTEQLLLVFQANEFDQQLKWIKIASSVLSLCLLFIACIFGSIVIVFALQILVALSLSIVMSTFLRSRDG